jgi:hypothetical protein
MVTVPGELVTIGVAKSGSAWAIVGLESTDHALNGKTFKTAGLARSAVETAIETIAAAIGAAVVSDETAALATDATDDDAFDAEYVPGSFDASGEFTPETDDTGAVVEDLPAGIADPTVTADVPATVEASPEIVALRSREADLVAMVEAQRREMAEMRAFVASVQSGGVPAAFAGPNAPQGDETAVRAAIIDDAMANAPASVTVPATGDGETYAPAYGPDGTMPADVAARMAEYDSFAGASPEAITRKMGRRVFGQIRDDIRTYMKFPDALSEAYAGVMALWAMHTHTYFSQGITPYILLTSPTAGAGKSTLIGIMSRVIRTPAIEVNPTPAVIRGLAGMGHSLMIDECDELYASKDFKSILNAGYKRGGTVSRWKGKEIIRDVVFGPKLFAGIGREDVPLSGALLTRCIVVWLERALPGERPAFDPEMISSALRDDVEAWARRAVGMIERRPANMPDLATTRAIEIWGPLVAVADAIGYGKEAREWAESIESGRETAIDPSVQLLMDTRDVIAEWLQKHPGETRIPAETLCELRNGYPSRLFADRLNGIAYGRRLSRFGIKSMPYKGVRMFTVGDGRGALTAELADTFARYCD